MNPLPGFSRLSHRPRLIGHRGVRRATIPENTLDAFEAAAREGAEAIELDVRVCASGELVVLHDPDFDRMTHGAERRTAASLPFNELASIELAPGVRTPLLAEVLDFARRLALPVNIELKRDVPNRPALVCAAARLLSSWDPAHAILVSSFDPFLLLGLRALLPRLFLALLIHPTQWTKTALSITGPLGVEAVHLEHTLATPDRVRAFQKKGAIVNVWTVNDPTEARRLSTLGVDGIITDEPGLLREALE